jgi:hypothetical protein
MKSLVLTALLCLICPGIVAGQSLVYQDKTDCVNGGEGKGEVTIKADSHTLRRDQSHRIKYTFHSFGSYAVYNWQFNRLLALPGQLAIYDADKRYLGDLIAFRSGSRRGLEEEDWSFLYGESYLGKPIDFRVDHIWNSKYDVDLLPVGTYYVQLVMSKVFFSLNPFRTFGDKPDFYETFDRSELCRSNAIRIEIVDQ